MQYSRASAVVSSDAARFLIVVDLNYVTRFNNSCWICPITDATKGASCSSAPSDVKEFGRYQKRVRNIEIALYAVVRAIVRFCHLCILDLQSTPGNDELIYVASFSHRNGRFDDCTVRSTKG